MRALICGLCVLLHGYFLASAQEKAPETGAVATQKAEAAQEQAQTGQGSQAAVDTAAAAENEVDEAMDQRSPVNEADTAEAGADTTQEGKAPVPVTGSLAIKSVPGDAVVVIGDVMRGRTPVTVDGLAEGEHVVLIKKKGYFLKKATVAVTADSTVEVRFQLTEPLELMITSEPAGATAVFDGTEVGTTPCAVDKLKPGEHELILRFEGYTSVTRTVSLTKDSADTLHVVLEAAAGSEKAAEAGSGRSPKSRLVNRVALGIFLAFTLVIVIVELADTSN
ncbi:MAG: PEGA domain-containing protein [Chitinivibrionales bacterium]|nr:PEGA domain-containing protein [Chitinivibrionales bacterium]MBD3394362.1 PEGA domain-containing protein [Chitinivibrionales bacterium]